MPRLISEHERHIRFEHAKAHASARGGSCLSLSYEKRLRFSCLNGHEWSTTWEKVRRQQWCGQCSGTHPTGEWRQAQLIEAVQYAISHGGHAQPSESAPSRRHFQFRCQAGHEWVADWSQVQKRKSWCGACSRSAASKARAAAHGRLLAVLAAKGGALLSAFTKTSQQHVFQCGEGHQWSARATNVLNGHWCHRCDRRALQNSPEVFLEEARAVANRRGGLCLSSDYQGAKTKLRFRCGNGHEWDAQYNNVVNSGRWCPYCTKRSENLVRAFMQCVFGRPFRSESPSWLNTDKGRFTLDGYSNELKVAFEYQGVQHYQRVEHFHRAGSPKTLERQIERDAVVLELCKANNVRLLVVPPFPVGSDERDVAQHVSEQLQLQLAVSPTESHFQQFYAASLPTSELKRLQAIAAEREGLCLDTKYLGTEFRMRFECKYGHQFSTFPQNVLKGTWCAVCAGKRVHEPLAWARQYASDHGGACTTQGKYSPLVGLQFRCSNGHSFTRTLGSLRADGGFCSQCRRDGGTQDLLPYCQNVAARHEGACLSTVLRRKDCRIQTVDFCCKEGHRFSLLTRELRLGAWCDDCGKISTIV
jgi:hypothetical protein